MHAWKSWAAVRAQARRFLRDTSETSPKYGNDMLLDAANWALEELLQYAPPRKRATFSSSDTTVLLPTDFYRAIVVQFPEGVFIEETKLQPGTNWYSQGVVDTTSLPNMWYVDDDYLYLLRQPDDDWYLWYYAYHGYIENENSLVKCPRWYYQAMTVYIAAVAVLSRSTEEAELNRWQGKRDAGKPTDNPLLQEADRLYVQYNNIVQGHIAALVPEFETWHPGQRRR